MFKVPIDLYDISVRIILLIAGTSLLMKDAYQGSHIPFWDWGPGPLELGKIAVFSLKLGKNTRTYFVIHILVSFNCTCTSCILHGTFGYFNFTHYYSRVYHFFSPLF